MFIYFYTTFVRTKYITFMNKDKRIVFRIEDDLYDKFKDICNKNGKSVSKVLRNYIDKVVSKHDEESN